MAESTSRCLDDWLTWMETLHPSEIDLGLSRITDVGSRLGIQKASSKAVTVAGTNGKGSCVHALESLLLSSGATVGTYTSPHIQRYNERIRLNGDCVSDEQLCSAFEKINQARAEVSLTYFEFGTLAALLLFQESSLDFWVLEVGLGGRLDAVNIIDPDIAIITSIDLDHESWLGESREVIAVEKLGILRPGIPCVCSETRLTKSMETGFQQNDVSLYLRGDAFGFQRDQTSTRFHYSLFQRAEHERENGDLVKTISIDTPALPLPSVSAALQAFELCSTLHNAVSLDSEEITKVVASLTLPGRFELIETPVMTVVLDVAHNPAATKLLADNLEQRVGHADYAVIAMMSDKKMSAALAPICSLVSHWLPAKIEYLDRSASSNDLGAALSDLDVGDDKVQLCQNVPQALETIVDSTAKPSPSVDKPTVLVFGSFFTVEAAKAWINDRFGER
ncbi:MAG: bifunctional folylpolyglutamate synthase/dihydrofolate synthase [Agarilytica sp.]